jgi:rhodanese-related sulfurtransferase
LTSVRPLAEGRAAPLPDDSLPLEIAPAEFAEIRSGSRPYAVFDVREPWELAICHFPEAIHLPLGSLPEREHTLPGDRPLIVVCHSGRRSLLATRHLRRAGLQRAVNLRGGVEAYALEIESMARY